MKPLLKKEDVRVRSSVIVYEQLQSYAQRGVFRSFSQTRASAGQSEFRFYWLWNLPFQLSFDSKRKSLTFKNLLPGLTKEPELKSRLKALIQQCCSSDQPDHRRIDPKRVSIRCSNTGGNLSLAFLVAGDDYEYGIKKALSLVSEIFVGFLNVYFSEYIAEHFRVREE